VQIAGPAGVGHFLLCLPKVADLSQVFRLLLDFAKLFLGDLTAALGQIHYRRVPRNFFWRGPRARHARMPSALDLPTPSIVHGSFMSMSLAGTSR
jgi:hypothetical protein